MLDRKQILSDPQRIINNGVARGGDREDVRARVDRITLLESQRVVKLRLAEELNAKANATSKQIPKAADNDERMKLIAQGKQIRQEKDAAQKEHDSIDSEIVSLETSLPNLTHPDVPAGGEDDATELFLGKTPKPDFDFKPLDHVELGEKHDLFDFESAGRVAGSGFYYLKNAAVRLDMALQMFAISFLQDRGFTPVTTPDLALTSILEGIGFNPRGPETQIYSIENTELNLVGTAEITLGGMMAGQTLNREELPLKLCGLSHCFRTEAGAAGRATKGLYRVHQFTKVEMFAFTGADQSDAMHLELRDLECEIFDALEVPYRVIDTAAGDLGGPAYRKFDLEAWMPGRGEGGQYGEVTSTSNCTDYQARRLNVRSKTAGQKGTKLVHTLNGTAVATGRAMIAVLENHQQADGSVRIPKALQPWMGSEVIA